MIDEETKAPRVIKVVTLFTIGLIVLVMGVVFQLVVWSFQPSQVLTVNNTPVPVQPPEVRDGDEVSLTIDYCIAKGGIARTEVALVGKQGAKIAINWPDSRTEKGCNVLPKVPITIPGQTPSDIYYAEYVVCYDVNPIKKNKCTTFTSQEFKVINQKLNPGDAKVAP